MCVRIYFKPGNLGVGILIQQISGKDEKDESGVAFGLLWSGREEEIRLVVKYG